MPTFLHNYEYSGTSYEDKRLFQAGDEVPDDLLNNPLVMFYTDAPIYVPPKVGTPAFEAEERAKRMKKAEAAAYRHEAEEKRLQEEQDAANAQRAKALAEAAGLGNYAPGDLPGGTAPVATAAPRPLRQPLRQPLGQRRAASN